MNALISVIPIVLLFVLMLGFKVASHWSALSTLIVTILIGIFAAPMLGIVPEQFQGENIGAIVGWSVVEGTLKAVFPILLIILTAIYSYNILVKSKQIEVIKTQFTQLTDDRGILVLIMTWGFGGLLEGMAGFGTAVAIPAAILIGLGFKPMFSALVALLGNSVPTAFGAVGVPVTTLCNEITPGGVADPATIADVSAYTILQLAPLFFLVPFVILMLTDRKAWGKNIVLALWTGAFSLGVQFISAKYLGAETPAILGSIAAILSLILYNALFCRKKKAVVAMAGGAQVSVQAGSGETGKKKYTMAETFKAWSVYIFILVFILLSGALCPPINSFLKSHLVSTIPLTALHSTFKFGWISNAALMLLLGSVIGGLIQGLTWRQLAQVMATTLVNLRFTTITIVSLIALASVMNYTGMIASIAIGLVTITGKAYPLFAPLIGAIGTFVTGSDTSSNILFAKLQANVAHQLGMTGTHSYLGVTGSETDWLAASNTTGATGGKMISPQSIAIATAACDMKGKDDAILRKAIPYALGYIVVAGLMVYFGI